MTDSICQKCDGEGWLLWNELSSYYGPETGEEDTKYVCDMCCGSGFVEDEEE